MGLTYKYILKNTEGTKTFRTNYDLLNDIGINLVPEHSEQNAYEEFGRWNPYKAGEWRHDPAVIVKDEMVHTIFRVKRNSQL